MSQGFDYTSKQMARDAEHARNLATWVESLPPAEQAHCKSLGLDKPDISYHGSGMSDHDMADSPLACEQPAVFQHIDEQEGIPDAPYEQGEDKLLDVLRLLIAEVLAQGNTRLTLECLALSCGMPALQGESMTSIAKRHGITRAAVSKRCVDITDKLNLPPSRAMRSMKARLAYREVQTDLYHHNERISHPRR